MPTYFAKRKLPFKHNTECYMTPLSQVDAAWIAAMYEGEGCIIFRSNGSQRQCLRLMISQKGTDLADILTSLTGIGATYESNKSGCFHWSLANYSVIAFMKQILPHMRIPYKVNQAVNALSNFVYERQTTNKTARRLRKDGKMSVKYYSVKPFVVNEGGV